MRITILGMSATTMVWVAVKWIKIITRTRYVAIALMCIDFSCVFFSFQGQATLDTGDGTDVRARFSEESTGGVKKRLQPTSSKNQYV